MSLLRLAKIAHILRRYNLVELIPYRVPLYVKLVLWLLSWHKPYVKTPRYSSSICCRRALEELGPIFVKFGQILATRRDLLSLDLALELEKLTDAVAPFSGDLAVAQVEAAFNKPVDKIFASFNKHALASASVAQVHTARLLTGEEVVVKIIRPKLEKIIKQDISLLKFLVKIMQLLWSDTRRLCVLDILDDYHITITAELDLTQEAANCTQIRRSFLNSNLLYIPKVYWAYNHKNILVLEKITALAVTDIDNLHKNNIDLKILAQKGVEIFLTQVFRDGFFHADMHPGNILVATTNSQDPTYIGIDFGIVGVLSHRDQYLLLHLLLAFLQYDYYKIARLHIEAGWVDRTTNLLELTAIIRTLCEPIMDQSLHQISYAAVLIKLFKLTRKFNMRVQPQLILFQKTLFNIEGLGHRLCPDLDLWQTLAPQLKKILRHRIGAKSVLRSIKYYYPEFIEHLPQIRQKMCNYLSDKVVVTDTRIFRWLHVVYLIPLISIAVCLWIIVKFFII